MKKVLSYISACAYIYQDELKEIMKEKDEFICDTCPVFGKVIDCHIECTNMKAKNIKVHDMLINLTTEIMPKDTDVE